MNWLTGFTLCGAALLAPSAPAERVNWADDDAAHSAYRSGWNSGKNAGGGFGGWELRVAKKDEDSHAGFFIAKRGEAEGLKHAELEDRAFGLYANGKAFEAATGFRAIDNPFETGDSFSLLMEAGTVTPKFGRDDPKPGLIGFSLRTGTAHERWEQWEDGARFRFFLREGSPNYLIADAESEFDTGIPVGTAGLAVTLTLTTPDTYDLEVIRLDRGEVRRITGRRLGGASGSPLESFAIVNQDGESANAYFNGFQVSRVIGPLPR